MYRSIVDLIMLRVNMVLQSTSMSYADVVSVDDMSPQVCKCLSDTFTEKYADMRFISIKLAADEIVKLVKDAIVQQCNAASTSQDVREAEDIMLVSSVHDAPGEEDESLQTYAVQDQDKAKQQQNQPDESSENIAFASISTYVDVHMSKLAELCVGSINYT